MGSNLGTWQGPVVDGRKAVESLCVDQIGPTSQFAMGSWGPAREYQKYETVIKQQINTFDACWEVYLCILVDCLYNLANVTH